MFERFTDQSRRAVVLAQEGARRVNHDHIGTEHVLAGLLREECGATARTLKASSITLDAVREARG
jgi:ATP-dependent Clp protease ATP-binding subunit ClpC